MKRSSITPWMMFLPMAFGTMAHAHAPLVEATDFGSNPGHLRMFYYVPPPQLPADAPLVVVAHGCLQTAQEMADTSGWVELAGNTTSRCCSRRPRRRTNPGPVAPARGSQRTSCARRRRAAVGAPDDRPHARAVPVVHLAHLHHRRVPVATWPT
ncbi:hypothetical protein [Rhodanobacter lindaniclasticus]